MKKLLVLIAIGISLNGFGQLDTTYRQKLNIDEETKLISFERVVEVPEETKNELYSRAREWFVTTYKSADDVLQMEDKESGKLIGKAFQDIFINTTSVKMYYTIKVYLKEGRYKSIVTDIRYQGYVSQYNMNPPVSSAEIAIIDLLYKPNGKIRNLNKTYKIRTINNINALLDDLDKSMLKPSSSTGDNDW